MYWLLLPDTSQNKVWLSQWFLPLCLPSTLALTSKTRKRNTDKYLTETNNQWSVTAESVLYISRPVCLFNHPCLSLFICLFVSILMPLVFSSLHSSLTDHPSHSQLCFNLVILDYVIFPECDVLLKYCYQAANEQKYFFYQLFLLYKVGMCREGI